MATDYYAAGLKLADQGDHAGAIERFERALAEKPNDAPTLFALGNTARALGMTQAAGEFYRMALDAAPGRIEPLVNLASLLRDEGRFAAAEALLLPALMRDPQSPDLCLALGNTYRERGDHGRAEKQYRLALEARPEDAAALGNLADLMADAGEDAEALALYGRVLAADPGHAQARLNRAIFHLSRGRLGEGWRDYEARLALPKAPHCDHGLPRWDGGSLNTVRLLVTAEQGIGDQAMFASMMPDLAARAAAEGGTVLLECEPRLVPLFSRSFPGISVHRSHFTTLQGVVRGDYGWLGGGADMAVEMGSLPRILRPSTADFPAPHAYLRPDQEEAARWRTALAPLPRPHIGLCWRSGKTGGHRSVQYAPLEQWAAFLRDLPGTPVVAQYDAGREEIADLERLSGREIALPEGLDQKQELDRATALFSGLDAMVSAPTAVAWLAAAAGVPTLKVQCDRGWTSFGEDYEPFAPSALLAMPQTRGDWAAAFAQAQEKLRAISG